MAADAAREHTYYTYADYCGWDETPRCELINGEVFMLPAPSDYHQGIVAEFVFQLKSFLKNTPCKVFPAPYDVRLFPAEDESDGTVVQPDVVVICDRRKRDARGCRGAPDMVIEILSPATVEHDTITKFGLYLDAGVREYWIVDPQTKRVHVHILDGDRYIVSKYSSPQKAAVSVLPGCEMDLAGIFAN
jgi:Uma2 family endonuclease